MPEAVIVATARSPIGRAFKGSLKDIRPDDLATTIVRAALDKVPALDPHDIDDLMLGCGLPGGEQGMNMGRVVAVNLGYDFLPGTTITRYCSSSLQTTRMALHAIRAGEGDAFISAGVETVSRFVAGNSDMIAGQKLTNPIYDDAQARTAKTGRGRCPTPGPTRARAASCPTSTSPWARRRRTSRGIKGVTRQEMDEFAARSQNLAEKAIANGFFEREITPVTTPDGTVVSTDDGPRPGVTVEGMAGLKPVFRPDGLITAGNACPLNDGASAVIVMSDTKAAELGITPLARIVSTAVTGLSPEIMGYGPVEATRKALALAGMTDRRHRPVRDQRGVRRAGHPVLPRPGHPDRQAERQRRRHRARPPVRLHRRAHHRHAAQRPAVDRHDLRPGDHVRRRRHGHGDGGRAPELSPAPPDGRSLHAGAGRRRPGHEPVSRTRPGRRRRRPCTPSAPPARPGRPHPAGRAGAPAGAPSCARATASPGPGTHQVVARHGQLVGEPEVAVEARAPRRRGAPSRSAAASAHACARWWHQVGARAPRRCGRGVARGRPQPQALHERAALAPQQVDRARPSGRAARAARRAG